MFLLVAAAGVWGDRLPRQLVMLSSDVVRCASQGTTAALLLLHQAQVWELVALQAVYGAANAFFMPAQIGLIPAVVGSGQLREANALMSLSRTAAGIAVGGFVAVRFGASRPLFWGELACGLSALPALFLGLGLPLAPIVAVSFVRSIGLAWGDTLWFTALQEHVPERAISRVISLD